MRRIRWTESAVVDLTRVCDYIEQHYGSARARSVALKIYEATERSRDFPTAAGLTARTVRVNSF